MNWILALIAAVAVYPGLLVAAAAAWLLMWVRGATRAALGNGQVQGLFGLLNELRSSFGHDTLAPVGAQPILLPVATILALAAPLTALVLLPVPGNPLVASIGLKGDLLVETALLLGVPFVRMFIGWAISSPFGSLAADRNARLVAGCAVPLAFAVMALAQQVNTFEIIPADAPSQVPLPFVPLVARVLAGAAFACCLPVLAHSTALREGEGEVDAMAGEFTDLSGRDLAILRAAEAVQLVAVGAFFAAAFVLPLVVMLPATQRWLIWVAVPVLTAVGIGVWEGARGARPVAAEKPPLSWWFGVPVLIALCALVAAAWATRVG